MITLISYPEAGDRHKYYAVNNPIIYTFQMDGHGGGAYNTYSMVVSGVGFGDGRQCQLLGDHRNIIRVGDTIKINDIHIRTITATGFVVSTGFMFFSINSPVPRTLNATITSVSNYRAELRVFHGRKEIDLFSGQLIMQQVGTNIEATPDASGIIQFNVQPYLKPFINFDTLLSPGKKNTVDRGVWGRFYVQARERYQNDGKDDTSGWLPETPTHANMRWWVSGVRQLRQPSGVSMHPEINSSPSIGVPMGKFLTSWKEPEYYIGYPNEIAFGWPDVLGFGFLRLREEKLSPTKQTETVRNFALLNEGRQEINRLRIDDYTASGFIRLSVEPFSGTESYVQPGYVLQNFVE